MTSPPVAYRLRRAALLLGAALGMGVALPTALSAQRAVADWPVYGGDDGGSRYSPLTQLAPANVNRLEIAWVHRSGEPLETAAKQRTSYQATPILRNGTLYVSTALGRVFALDPRNGKERWRFDARVDPRVRYAELASRGVAFWEASGASPSPPCRRRVFLGTIDARLIALDAETGQACPDFGQNGTVDLSRGIAPRKPGEYGMTSPPAVLGDRVIVGSFIGDNQRADEASGRVRAFDARSGALLWSWEPLQPRSARGAESGQISGAGNAWSLFSVDAGRDLVFVPTGSASPDFYGGQRRGSDRHANSIAALRGSTGQLVWSFQVVHHDLWDYDVPAQPVLVTLSRKGEAMPAVVQATKTGHLFVLHRESGEPLFPVEERPTPPTTVPGEEAWPTQPIPRLPPPLVPQSLSPADAWGLTFWDRGWCARKIASLRSEGMFTPPSVEGSIIFPGNAGGTNWGSLAFDPERQWVIVNSSRVAHFVTLIPRERYEADQSAHPNILGDYAPQVGTPYGMRRELLLSPFKLPCNGPPWGTLAAVDLKDGSIRWEVPLGTPRDFSPVPVWFRWGTPNMGGPIVTAGGLVFIGAAMDNYLRAFDVRTGEELWKGRLPAGGQATPMTYQLDPSGKQYVVIAAGGHGKMDTTPGDHLVAFALP